MNLGIQEMVNNNQKNQEISTPRFFRLAYQNQKEQFNVLLSENPFLFVYDELVSQLEELVKSLFPQRKLSKNDLSLAIDEHLNGKSMQEYGVWVFYPWSNRLVHILDEKEFVLLRTNRNRNKITNEEQEILSTKKVGIIGLSVGQSVAITMAMERSCGELRIADFDTLELSNLNRIRTGVHNLGLKKTVAVAREIAEIDPFLKTTCYHEGVTEENIDQFLTVGGQLDILVDECDSLDMKILCRQRAKSFKIPVVMESSDRGMVDIERFDIDPDRPILHGYIDHLEVDNIKWAKSTEEKLPYVLAILGYETISNRLKTSMQEIGKTISTWPQLASSVTMGGGIGADVCRKIALNQTKSSGRFFVDIDNILEA